MVVVCGSVEFEVEVMMALDYIHFSPNVAQKKGSFIDFTLYFIYQYKRIAYFTLTSDKFLLGRHVS